MITPPSSVGLTLMVRSRDTFCSQGQKCALVFDIVDSRLRVIGQAE